MALGRELSDKRKFEQLVVAMRKIASGEIPPEGCAGAAKIIIEMLQLEEVQ